MVCIRTVFVSCLGAFATCERVTISFVMVANPHATTLLLDEFSWNIEILRKSVEKIQVWLKSGKYDGCFLWRRICVYCIYMKTYLRLLYLYEDVSAFIVSIWRRICVYYIYMKTYLRLLYLYEDVSAFIVSIWRRICVYCIYMKTYLRLLYLCELFLEKNYESHRGSHILSSVIFFFRS